VTVGILGRVAEGVERKERPRPTMGQGRSPLEIVPYVRPENSSWPPRDVRDRRLVHWASVEVDPLNSLVGLGLGGSPRVVAW